MTILVGYSPLLLISVAITLLLAPPLKSLLSSATRLLPFCIAVQPLHHVVDPDNSLVIGICLLSFCSSCKYITSALHSTTVSRAAMRHSDVQPQMYWMSLMIGRQGSRFSLNFRNADSTGRYISLSHRDISCLPQCILFFVHIRHFLFVSHSFCHPIGHRAKHHSVRACWHCHLTSFIHGLWSRQPHFVTLLCRFGSFRLLHVAATEREMISLANRALLPGVATE